jgi:HPr kinase/phosphorylase
MSAGPASVHASCVAIGEAGVLIRGRSGAGKSSLARKVVEEALSLGCFARLVSDDRTLLERRGGRLLAKPHPAVAGRIEVRGLGIAKTPHEEAVRLCLIVDVAGDVAALPRMPELRDERTVLDGVELPRIAVGPGDSDKILIALGRATVER